MKITNKYRIEILMTRYMYFLFAAYIMLDSCLAYSSNLKMEVTFSSETSVDFQLTKLRYNPEDRTLKTECPLSLTLLFSNTHLQSQVNAI
jgi:hypothetical protein